MAMTKNFDPPPTSPLVTTRELSTSQQLAYPMHTTPDERLITNVPLPSSEPPSLPAADVFPSLLYLEPVARPDLDELRQALSFAFASGVSGGLFSQALDRAPIAPSTWDPKSFTQDLFLEELVARCFQIGRASCRE